jgi:putative transposase
VIAKLQSLAEKHPTRGFWVYYGRIRNEGNIWNHKRIKRVYNLMGLNIRRKHKRRLPNREKQPLEQPYTVNQKWSMDFMSDALTDGRKFRTFNPPTGARMQRKPVAGRSCAGKERNNLSQ